MLVACINLSPPVSRQIDDSQLLHHPELVELFQPSTSFPFSTRTNSIPLNWDCLPVAGKPNPSP